MLYYNEVLVRVGHWITGSIPDETVLLLLPPVCDSIDKNLVFIDQGLCGNLLTILKTMKIRQNDQ